MCTILVWRAGVDRPDGRLSMTVLESEGGQGVLLTSPGGRSLLIGGGSDATALREAVSRRLPLLQRSLDWLIVGSSDSDSLAGLQGISEHLRLEAALVCGERRPQALVNLQAELAATGTRIEPAAAGQRFDLGGEASLEVLEVSEHGCLLLARNGQASFMLAPGADPNALHTVLKDSPRLPVTAYVAAGSGHPAVNPPEWLEALSPRIVILAGDPTVAAGNAALPQYAAAHAARLLDTLTYGWIRLETDGERLWIWTERLVP